jgi:mRNA-degrading endonuclease RelE of RelBE toxin-antitoxin system
MFRAVTATQVIRQLEKLPARERRKVFAYVDSALDRREEIEDRKAIEEVRRDPRPAVPWKVVKARIGLA